MVQIILTAKELNEQGKHHNYVSTNLDVRLKSERPETYGTVHSLKEVEYYFRLNTRGVTSYCLVYKENDSSVLYVQVPPPRLKAPNS